jgi:hypothetical protein
MRDLIMDALAAWRLVRLVRVDYIMQPLRDRIYEVLAEGAPPTTDEHEIGTCRCGHPREMHHAASGAAQRQGACTTESCPCTAFRPFASANEARLRHPKLAALLECPYCLSMWAALVVAVASRLPLGRTIIRLLAVSAAAGELSARIDRPT